jgi:hypothetical protein
MGAFLLFAIVSLLGERLCRDRRTQRGAENQRPQRQSEQVAVEAVGGRPSRSVGLHHLHGDLLNQVNAV